LCRQGGFQAAVVASADGLPVAEAGAESETAAAVAAVLPNLVGRVPHLFPLDEIVILGQAAHRVVCRYFSSRGDKLILVVLSKTGVPYRRRTGEALRALQRVWESSPRR
jgi:predicted regulator of Ras-like GTPase activity (Roadblock/LC7/MglB family)